MQHRSDPVRSRCLLVGPREAWQPEDVRPPACCIPWILRQSFRWPLLRRCVLSLADPRPEDHLEAWEPWRKPNSGLIFFINIKIGRKQSCTIRIQRLITERSAGLGVVVVVVVLARSFYGMLSSVFFFGTRVISTNFSTQYQCTIIYKNF